MKKMRVPPHTHKHCYTIARQWKYQMHELGPENGFPSFFVADRRLIG